MNRLLHVCVVLALGMVGCSTTSNTANQNTNKTTTTSTVIPAPTPASTANTNTPAGEKIPDITGGYFPVGTLPVQFSEIEHLSLALVDDQGNPSELNGFIRPKRRSDPDYKLVSPKITGKDLTFTTTTVAGVGYSFKGTF